MTLARNRRAIRHLLDEQNPADAMASYFAFSHPENKTTIVTYPPNPDRAEGYVAFSRTGMDLFRPLVTLRFPVNDLRKSAALIDRAMPPGTAVILNSRARDY
ncbi:MAG: hypothetical protein GY943_16705, partial [Chloroflexi bacterium]|nr:hypothetical protein [Chloroflexota bacterium]